jgi:hypothetical protein
VAGEPSGAEPTLDDPDRTEPDQAPPSAADEGFTVRVAALAVIVFSAAWVIVGFLAAEYLYGSPGRALQVDLYRTYAENVLGGQIPYRDFAFEYPPLALVPILGPLLIAGRPVTEEGYRVAFQLFAAGMGMVTMLFVLRTVAALHLTRRDVVAAALVIAASPLLLGPLLQSRYDLWPALFAAATLWCFVTGRHSIAAIALGLGVLAKVYPIVLAPVLAVYLWRTFGPRKAIQLGLITATTVFVGVAPFYLVAPDGIVGSMTRAFQRPLQVEAIGASLIYAANVVTHAPPIDLVHTFDSYNLSGAFPEQVATVQTALLALVLLVTVVLLVRGPMTLDRLVIASAAAITAYVALGKVFSPQYLIWLIAPVVVVPSRRWPVHVLAIALAIVLTGWYYPRWYVDYYVNRQVLWVAVVLARNLVLVALTLYLVARLLDRGRPQMAGRALDGAALWPSGGT